MKKKLVALVMAFALAMAMPTMAFAAPSPSGESTFTKGGVTFVIGDTDFTAVEIEAFKNALIVETHSNPSAGLANKAAEYGGTVVYYRVYLSAGYDARFPQQLTLQFPSASVIIHETATETYDISKGTSIAVTGFSDFAVVTLPTGGSETSPKTGMESTAGLALVGGFIVVAAAAGLIAYSRRARNN